MVATNSMPARCELFQNLNEVEDDLVGFDSMDCRGVGFGVGG